MIPTHVGRPVHIEARKIKAIVEIARSSDRKALVETLPGEDPSVERTVILTPEMCARYQPNVGDYAVAQADGYVYVCPAEVLERKYAPIEPAEEPTA